MHTSHWSETGNTIVSALHDIITKWRHGCPLPETLILTGDNHSTNKNWTIIGYLYCLVVHLRIFKKVIFALTWPNHGKGPTDQAHQGIGHIVQTTPVIASLPQLANLTKGATDSAGRRQYKGHVLEDIWDWETFLKAHMTMPKTVKIDDAVFTDPIKGMLVFTFTQQGVTFSETLCRDDVLESISYKLFPDNFASVLTRTPLHRVAPFLMTRDINGRVRDSKYAALKAAIDEVASAHPHFNTDWAKSVLNETWPALHDKSTRKVITRECTIRRHPVQPIPTSKEIVQGQCAFIDFRGQINPVLAEIEVVPEDTLWFKGMFFALLFPQIP